MHCSGVEARAAERNTAPERESGKTATSYVANPGLGVYTANRSEKEATYVRVRRYIDSQM